MTIHYQSTEGTTSSTSHGGVVHVTTVWSFEDSFEDLSWQQGTNKFTRCGIFSFSLSWHIGTNVEITFNSDFHCPTNI
jgi:hypothetical protein